MTISTKVNGIYVPVVDSYRKVSGAWDQVENIYLKRNGVWTSVYAKPGAPLSPPVLSAALIKGVDHNGVAYRYIKVGARYTGLSNEPAVKLIRVLAQASAMPSSQFSTTGYIQDVDIQWPYEPWSDWYYNAAPEGAPSTQYRINSSVLTYKAYLPNYDTTSQKITTGLTYNFAGWTLDQNNQWSTGASTSLQVNTDTLDNLIQKSAVIRPRFSGTQYSQTSTNVSGDLIVRSNGDGTASHGLWNYQNQITNVIGESSTPTITSAKIRITRKTTGGFSGAAHVWLYRVDHPTSQNEFVPSADRLEPVDVGTIALGQTKTFDLPSSWYDNFDTGLNSIGLHFQLPAGTTNTANMDVPGIDNDYRSGELILNWTETS